MSLTREQMEILKKSRKVGFAIITDPEQDSVADNFDDEEIINNILEDFTNGNVWAWCSITIIASVQGNSNLSDIVGRSYLGCCSFKDRDEFVRDDYYLDMCNEAFEELMHKLNAVSIDSGKEHREILSVLTSNGQKIA